MIELALIALAFALVFASHFALTTYGMVRWRDMPQEVRTEWLAQEGYGDFEPLPHIASRAKLAAVSAFISPKALLAAVAIAAAFGVMEFPDWQILALAGILGAWVGNGYRLGAVRHTTEVWLEATGGPPPRERLAAIIYLVLLLAHFVSWSVMAALLGIQIANAIQSLV